MSLATCPECGAPLPDGRTCRDHFDALLLLEGEIPGVPGSILHFYAVAAYALQHPDSMNFTASALDGLRHAVAEALSGRAGLDDLRRRARLAAAGPARVLRHPDDPPFPWPRGRWPTTVADVCTAETFGEIDQYDEYAERATRWARCVCETLERWDSSRRTPHAGISPS